MLKLFNSQRVKPRQFDYKPRYYNPDRDELDKQLARARRRGKSGHGIYVKSKISQHFQSSRGTTRTKHKNILRGSSMRLVIILFALIIFAYVILNQFLPSFMASWFPEQGY